jgi:Kef-type K+ transport system membrane component KefB
LPDYYGFIGGFLYGFLAALAMLPREFKQNGRLIWRDVIIALSGLIAIFLMTLILLIVFFVAPAAKIPGPTVLYR